ncbi:MAG TPA: NUDIX hydrolase [Anaerovoracaceae bacterium]|nr:NUDIX hydrolase [Anaerovoracaceae bacterium]
MVFEEKTISSEMIYEGRIINLRKDKVCVKNDQTSFREIVEHNGGVALAAVTPEGKMVMVLQYRKAAEKAILEVPAGKIEKDEDHRLTAERELKEETGYTAGKIEYITSFYSSIGYSTEVIYLYLATDLTPGETDFDENESIEVLEYGLPELKRMVLGGEIEDAKTIAAILLTESIMEKEKIR